MTQTQQPTGPAVRVLTDFAFPHRGGPMLTFYRRGEIVFGPEAREIAHRREVAVLGEEHRQRCPACMAVIPVETIRTGNVIVVNALRAITPVRMMLGERWVEIPAGAILELLWAPEAASTIFEQAADRFELSGLTVHRTQCPACGAPADYAITPGEARVKKISVGGDEK